ncbi:MAG: glycosyl hydrolase family 2, partial [Prevotella sp.]|nr:glycosyl hydrolase family 2 [Prevotella sp.]
MFCSGVNHIFFHGTCYSPKDDPWPGWKFYASIDMSPTNTIWRDAPYFMQYVERCQSFLQWGQPDNDFLVYLPIRDMWKKNPDKLLMQFSIHAMGALAPEFRQTILDIDRAGFDCDYISERLLMNVIYKDGMLQTEGGTRYKALIIPGSGNMPEKVKTHIKALQQQGAAIIYGVDNTAMNKAAKPEIMKSQYGLKAIRRKNDKGYHYFIANLTSKDLSEYITLATPFKQALWFNPLNGERYAATITEEHEIFVPLKSGQSMILQTFDDQITFNDLQENAQADTFAVEEEIILNNPWTLSFTEEMPKVSKSFTLDHPQTWELLGDNCGITMGTGIYTTHIKLKKKDLRNVNHWLIDLGDVRESARVYINGQFIGCAWSAPFLLDCKNTLKKGDNEIRIEVTNLPANRIADLDRQGVKWRKMEEINVVDIHYKKTTYEQWEPVKSGLNSAVRLIKR